WRITTRGSFARDTIHRSVTLTWHDGICQALGVSALADLASRLDPSLCYVCEFCSPHNTVIRRYAEPVLYLLSAFRGEVELPPAEVDALAVPPFRRPVCHPFGSIEAIQAFLLGQASKDPTFEGVVIRDRHGSRWKVKSPTYLGMHHLSTQGVEAFHPRH